MTQKQKFNKYILSEKFYQKAASQSFIFITIIIKYEDIDILMQQTFYVIQQHPFSILVNILNSIRKGKINDIIKNCCCKSSFDFL